MDFASPTRAAEDRTRWKRLLYRPFAKKWRAKN